MEMVMLPKYRDIYLPLLLEIAERGGNTRPSDHREGKTVYEALALALKLKREDLDMELEEPGHAKHSKWENMVRWARNDLVTLGYLDGSEWGVWKLTERGLEAAKSKKMFAPMRELLLLLSKGSPEAKSEIEKILKKAGVL
jgi:hypothetical protein